MVTRRFFSVFAVVAMTVLLTGCMRVGGEIDTTKSAKKYIESVTVWYDKAKVDGYAAGTETVPDMADSGLDGMDLASVMAEFQKYPVETIDGKEYYRGETEKSKEAYYSGTGKADPIVTRSSIYSADASEAVDDSMTSADEYLSELFERIEIKVTFKDKIKKTNGKLSKNKRTVTFSYDVKELDKAKEIYAYTVSAKRTLKQDRKTAKGAGKD